MEALTNYMKGVPTIKKIYLINQDYSFGQSVRTQARAMLKTKRPDVEIVGDELHPLLKITDFAPYVAKIKASGADSVITGNWGQDFALLLKAAADAGLKVNWYTYYAGGTGGPTAIKQAGLDHQVFQVTEGIANGDYKPAEDYETALRAKYDFSNFYPRAANEMRMFAAAAEKAKSLDPVKVASALEDMKFDVHGRRRRHHAQGRSPVLPADLHHLARYAFGQGKVRRGKDRLGLAFGRQDRHRADHAADHLQDAAAVRLVIASSFRMCSQRRLPSGAQARNPYSLRWLWIPGSQS